MFGDDCRVLADRKIQNTRSDFWKLELGLGYYYVYIRVREHVNVPATNPCSVSPDPLHL